MGKGPRGQWEISKIELHQVQDLTTSMNMNIICHKQEVRLKISVRMKTGKRLKGGRKEMGWKEGGD